MSVDRFREVFEALMGHEPFKWQERLFTLLRDGRIPPLCAIPTGLGKTSVIPIWLIALAIHSPIARRLIYVVNRRTVVDQATDDAQRIVRRLKKPGTTVLDDLRRGLEKLSGVSHGPPLAVSTLRGERADDGEWRRDPARPAIVIGTVVNGVVVVADRQ